MWNDGSLRSPASGAVLRMDGTHALSGGGERWPVVDGIPFLRADRRALADQALAALDANDTKGALVALLADQDNWARTPPPDEAARRRVVLEPTLTFRAAMDLLAFGAVGTYFAHRWSDPTFLSGLALAEAHWAPGPVFELACGAGHFLREFGRAGALAAGGDVVFAKLWLARRYVAPDARLVCFDAAAPWPVDDGAFATVFCHDAFYFLPNKPHVAAEMQRVAPRVLVGHAHNALAENLSAGSPMSPAGYAGLFGAALLYDDRELTAALVEARAPRAVGAEALADVPAVSMALGTGPARAVIGQLALPPAGTALRRNPLYTGDRVQWPSPRYEAEYAPLATYPLIVDGPETALAGDDPDIQSLARRRVLLDLPPQW